jgi:hypothetical protein
MELLKGLTEIMVNVLVVMIPLINFVLAVIIEN